jgi:plastocyanin
MVKHSRRDRPVRLSLFAALVVAGCIAAACGGGSTNTTSTTSTATPATRSTASSPAASSAAGGTVSISDNQFSPASLTVAKGAKVTWNWGGQNPHSVVATFDGQSVQSPTNTGSGTFSFTFNTPGTYNYHCGVHGTAMSATITVP